MVTRFSRCSGPQAGTVVLSCAELQDLIAGQYQLAGKIHQLVEQTDLHPNSADGGGLLALTSGHVVEHAPLWGLLRRALEELLQRAHDPIVVGGSVAPGPLDDAQQSPQLVHHSQQAADRGLIQCQLLIPQSPQQAFAGMRQRLQLGITQHAAAALQGVNRPEDFCQLLASVGVMLQFHQMAVEQVESFGSFRQEFLDDFFHAIAGCGHRLSPTRTTGMPRPGRRTDAEARKDLSARG